MPSVFICHSSKDKDFAERLATDLNAQGIGVWFDRWEILPGDSILGRIAEGLRRHDYLAIILSPASVRSSWVKMELEIALTSEIVKKRVTVIPILRKSCTIPAVLSPKHYVDFRRRYRQPLADFMFAIQRREAQRSKRLSVFGSQYPVQWITEECFYEIDLVARDGSLARITKVVRNTALQDESSYKHRFGSDGPVSGFTVTPGHIVNVYEEDGRTFVVHDFESSVTRGESITMTVSYTATDSFCKNREFWNYIANVGPTGKASLRVLFPASRPPKAFRSFVDDIAHVTPDPTHIRLSDMGGRPVITWEKLAPRFMQQYRIEWDW